MSTYTTRDGRTFHWTGHRISVCTHCDEVFNSVAAFDAHIRTVDGERVHDYSWMPRNGRGYLVTALRDDGGDE